MNRELSIVVGLFVIIFAAFGMLVYMSTAKPAVKTADMATLVRENTHLYGNTSAKVKLVEFGDFQCPACGAAFPIIEKLRADYASSSDVAFGFRHFPLPQHQNARSAAEAGEAAAAQGKFWEMYAQLYAHQNDWANLADPMPKYLEYAKAIGLDVKRFEDEVKANKYADVIAADETDVRSLSLDHTPTFFINETEVVNTGLSYESLKAQIEAALKK